MLVAALSRGKLGPLKRLDDRTSFPDFYSCTYKVARNHCIQSTGAQNTLPYFLKDIADHAADAIEQPWSYLPEMTLATRS
jgi:hypothetical protein